MQRRKFLQIASAATIATSISSCKLKKRNVKQIITYPNFKAAHSIPNPVATNTITEHLHSKILIVGAGISGLSAARYLNLHGEKDYILIDNESVCGGNSVSASSGQWQYPLGAHYLPIPHEKNSELIDFLFEVELAKKENDLLEFASEHICHQPSERLWIRGVWQNGILPQYGINKKEKEEITQFQNLIEIWQNKKGKDNLFVFDIPLSNCSKDKQWKELDTISFGTFIHMQGFTSKPLLWYLNYCIADDFGIDIHDCSAWAGLHYFCARKNHQKEVFTWPNGNNYLVKKLLNKIENKPRLNTTAIHIYRENKKWHIIALENSNYKSYSCEELILACPKKVVNKLFKKTNEINLYSKPWLVTNYQLSDDFFKNEELPNWDNVLYDSKNLGYVYAGNQSFNLSTPHPYITAYKAFTEKNDKLQRKEIMAAIETQNLSKFHMQNDLEKMHPNFDSYINEIHYHFWPHGMIAPVPNYISNCMLNQEKLDPKNLHCIHTDYSGISIFEEAFFNGVIAAKKILKHEN